MNPAIVVVPGHTFVGWETWEDTNEWRYVETTMIGSHSFEDARTSAEATAARYSALAQTTGDPMQFRRWSIPDLRTRMGITPME